MANHVSTWLEVTSDEPQVYQTLKKWFDGKDYTELGNTMFLYNTLYNNGEESEYDRELYSNRMGAKWVYTDNVEADEDTFQMNTVSAWYFIENAIERMGSLLSELDENLLIEFTFQDESLDPIGGGGWYKGEILSFDKEYEWPDEEADDYDEQMDDLWENVEEVCNDLKVEAVSELIDSFDS